MKGDVMKRKGIRLLVAKLVLTCILVGCECGPTVRERLKLLEVGMTKVQVREIMGRPYEVATYSDSEWLVYQTDSETEFVGYDGGMIDKPENEWLTPLLLRDEKLVGTDKNYWENKYKYRVLRYPLRY
jgi:outer membrane protein assembly factor BamE (lipoprotein component of BamABCDE complex)